MTQGDLGDILGVQKVQISKLENNTKDSRIGTILRALEALGAKVKLTVELEKKELIVAYIGLSDNHQRHWCELARHCANDRLYAF